MIDGRFGDNKEVMVAVHVGDRLPDTIMGSFWLGIMRLVADNPNGILTLEMLGVELGE